MNSKITELYDLSTGQSFTDFADFPIQIYSHTGGKIDKNKILICGGHQSPDYDFSTNCYTWNFRENGDFEQSASLNIPRSGSASVMTKNGLWITGGFYGWNENNTVLYSTEFVTPTQSIMGPEIPYAMAGHCIIKISDSTVMFTGGAYRYNTETEGSEINRGNFSHY